MDPSSDLSFLRNSSRNNHPCSHYKKIPVKVKGGVGKYWLPERLRGDDKSIGQGGSMPKKISTEEFVRLAIVKLRNEPYKGIHSVYSGFNEAFKSYYSGQDPVQATNQLAEDGKIVIRPMKGGVVLYLPEEAPLVKSRGEEALKKMELI
jgi:hypothetical protein